VDTAFDPGQMKIGRRLAMKIVNASKFALGFGSQDTGAADAAIVEPVDEAVLTQLVGVVEDATAAFAAYDYSRALKLTEEFFWQFCDDYLELVKDRAYGEGPGADSARTALRTVVSTVLRLFAPFLPYVTEEAWSMARTGEEDRPLPGFSAGSIHRSAWPTATEIRELLKNSDEPSAGEVSVLAVAADVLRQIRKTKSDAKKSVRAEVETVVVRDVTARITAVQAVLRDLKSAGNVAELTTVAAAEGEAGVEVVLREVAPAE